MSGMALRRWWLGLLLLLTALGFAQPAAPSPAKLRSGDTLVVIVVGQRDFTGEFIVQTDGAIYLPRIGRVAAEGRTPGQVESTVRDALRKVFRDPTVSVILKSQRTPQVYLLGAKTAAGPLQYVPGMDLRSVLANLQTTTDADLLSATVYREGRPVGTVGLVDLFTGAQNAFNGPIMEGDVVVVNEQLVLRVWVLGSVRTPGQIRLRQGDDVYRAIATAGDVQSDIDGGRTFLEDFEIVVRRGPETFRMPARPDPSAPVFRLQSGDSVTVTSSNMRVTVAGEVTRPGYVVVRRGTTVPIAITQAGGVLPQGSVDTVFVLRNGDVRLATGLGPRRETPDFGLPLEPEDIVYVPRNERGFTVLGDVMRPRRVQMADGRAYTAADALAEAGGLSPAGTNRRVALVRPMPDGTFNLIEFNLDEFLKDGKPEGNPEVLPGDFLFFGTPKGITLDMLTRGISSFLLLDRLLRGR